MEETLGCDVLVTHESRETSNRPVLFVGEAFPSIHEPPLRLMPRRVNERSANRLPRNPLNRLHHKKEILYEVAEQHQKRSSFTSALAQRTLNRRLWATIVASTNSKPSVHAYNNRVRILLHWPSREGSRTKNCTRRT